MPAKRSSEKILYISLGAVLLIALTIILYRYLRKPACPDFRIEVSSENILVNQPVNFTTKVESGNTIVWDFGDPNDLTKNSSAIATHKFKKEGKYSVTLTANDNDACFQTRVVIVKPEPVASEEKLLTPVIIGPNPPVAYVGRPVGFKDATDGATSWDWAFENGEESRTGKEVSYAFKNPGTQTVILMVNGKSNRGEFKITVKPSPHVGSGPAPKVPALAAADFIQILEGIRSGRRETTDFRIYLCGGDLTKMITVDGVPKQFDSFCRQYNIDFNIKPERMKVTLTKDPSTDCISNIDIKTK